LTVEPSGGRNFGNYWFNRAQHSKKGFLPVASGDDYPAYRYMGEASALKTYFAGDITMLPFVSDTHIEWPLMLTQEQKAAYIKDFKILEFSSFVVNKFAGSFRVYLKNPKEPGDWYAWNWAVGKEEKLISGSDGYAALTAENIGSSNEVIMFKVKKEGPVEPPTPPKGGGSGCNVGYAIFALLTLVPFAVKKRF
jgi:Synergist-CTERM protein sorting domain-containing protein